MKLKLPVLTFVALSLIVTVEAKNTNNNNNNNKNNAAQIAKHKEEQKKKAEAQEKKRDAVNAVLKVKDKNHDGSLTKEEYIAGEADAASAAKLFDKFNKNNDRYLSRQELEALLGL